MRERLLEPPKYSRNRVSIVSNGSSSSVEKIGIRERKGREKGVKVGKRGVRRRFRDVEQCETDPYGL